MKKSVEKQKCCGTKPRNPNNNNSKIRKDKHEVKFQIVTKCIVQYLSFHLDDESVTVATCVAQPKVDHMEHRA